MVLMKKAVQYGAGNIGRGFGGQLFSHPSIDVLE
jgi:mannitol-1-phosphate/altronate dehydrogenase